LEESQEKVKLLLGSASVKADTAGIEHHAYDSNSKEVIGHIERVESFQSRRTIC